MTIRPQLAQRLTAAMVAATLTLGGLVGCGGSSDTAAPVNPPLVGAEDTTGSKVLSWLEQVAESLYEVALGAAAIAHGNLKAGLFDSAAGVLGLVGKGLEAGETEDSRTEEIAKIDKKIETLIVDVAAIKDQVSSIEVQLDGMDAWQKNNAAMHDAMSQAQTWLDSNYSGADKVEQSREWARWYMAGCTYGFPDYACPSAEKPANAASLALFRQKYIQNPAQEPPNYTSNFPLWWAYSVIGNKGVDTFKSVNSADDIVTNLYHGLTDFEGQDTNGLISYMNLVMNSKSSGCTTDVTAAGCDLYNNVYLKLEAYFMLAIGRQSQLVMALAEAKNVLAQKDIEANGKTVNTLMANFNQKLNQQAEAFLQAAEHLALYRAADGRTDWSNFADTDAGRLLARADFVVARLAGKNYLTKEALLPGYRNPPWPSDGIVGRIFYADGEQMPADTATRSVCSSTDLATCSSALTQLSENTNAQRNVSGVQPYLVWKSTVDDKTGAVKLMTGTVTRQWHVQRLNPKPATLTTVTQATATTAAITTTTATDLTQLLPVGATYRVNSTQPLVRMPAKLAFNNYDKNFVTPPGPDTRPVDPAIANSPWVKPFASFSAVEGPIGRYGLKLDPSSFVKSGVDMPSWAYDDSYAASEIDPGAAKYYVRYVPNKEWNGNALGGVVGNQAGAWSARTAVQLVNPQGSAINVKVLWPSRVDVHLQSKFICSGAGCAGREEYYSYVKFKQQILDSKDETMNKGALVNDACNSDPFKHCSIPNTDTAVDANFTALKTPGTTKLSFKASFSTEVNQYTKTAAFLHFDETMRSSVETSYIQWDIQAPLFTLSR